jgi:hypothetical protein
VIRASSLELATTIVRSEHETLEDMNPFCRFLLKCGVKAGEKAPPWLVFNARALAESQIRDVARPEAIPGNTAPGR